MRSFIALLVIALAAPGCLGTDLFGGEDVVLDPAAILPYLDLSEEHDHADPVAHAANWNLDQTGWTPLTDDPATLGAYNQVQVFGDLAFVSAYALAPDGLPGLAIVDIADPSGPTVVGLYTQDRLTPIDVHLSEDGRYAAIAGHRLRLPASPPALPVDPCVGVPSPRPPQTVCVPYLPSGVQLIDVSDAKQPDLVASWSGPPTGAHTVKLATIGGELYAFIGSYGFSYADRMLSGVQIVRYDPSVPNGFALVSEFFPDETSGGRVFVHDMYVAVHPLTADTLLYVAYWDGGVVIANVNDPANPVQISAWNDFDVAEYGNIHFVQPMREILVSPWAPCDATDTTSCSDEPRHFTVAAPEFGQAEHAGETYILDTTDPTAPELIGKWTLPGNPVNPSGYMHSPHNFDLRGDRLVMGHYHAGVWVLDLREVFAGTSDTPTELGYFFPVPPADAGLDLDGRTLIPDVWNAVWTDGGRIVASDAATGLYVLDIADLTPGEPPYAGLDLEALTPDPEGEG